MAPTSPTTRAVRGTASLPTRLALATLFAAFTTALTPDAASPQDADPAGVESIDAIIGAVYDVISGDAGESRNWDRWHSLFAEGATLSAVGRRADGSVGRVIMTPQTWIDRSGTLIERDGFVEGEIGRVTERFGLIAHAFSTYASYHSRADTEPFQRGINSFQLMNDGTRWWVVSIFWQGESPAFPIPDEYIGSVGADRQQGDAR